MNVCAIAAVEFPNMAASLRVRENRSFCVYVRSTAYSLLSTGVTISLGQIVLSLYVVFP